MLSSPTGRVLAEEVRLISPSRRALRLVTAQLAKFGHVSFRWVPRDENAHVDRLVWTALAESAPPVEATLDPSRR